MIIGHKYALRALLNAIFQISFEKLKHKQIILDINFERIKFQGSIQMTLNVQFTASLKVNLLKLIKYALKSIDSYQNLRQVAYKL